MPLSVWLFCSVWCYHCIQASLPIFHGQCIWHWSFWSPHPCSTYPTQWDPEFREWSCCLVDRDIPFQGPASLRFFHSGSLPTRRNRREAIYIDVPGKRCDGYHFNKLIHIPYIFFVCLVQSICGFKLCLSCICYLLQYTAVSNYGYYTCIVFWQEI